jgi:hypothetical protein
MGCSRETRVTTMMPGHIKVYRSVSLGYMRKRETHQQGGRSHQDPFWDAFTMIILGLLI